MSQGKIHVQFTGDTNRLNRQIERLQKKISSMERQMRKTRDESRRAGSQRDREFRSWGRDIGRMAAGYMGLHAAVGNANEMLQRSVDVKKQAAQMTEQLYQSEHKLKMMLGQKHATAGTTAQVLDRTRSFGMREGIPIDIANYLTADLISLLDPRRSERVESIRDLLAPVLRGFTHDPQQMRGIGQAVAAVASRQWRGKDLLTPEMSAALVGQLTAEASIVDPAGIAKFIRGGSTAMLYGEADTLEKARLDLKQGLTLAAFFSKKLAETGAEMPAGAASQLLETMFRNFPELRGSRPFEAIDIIAKDPSKMALFEETTEKILGKGPSRAITQSLLTHRNQLREELEALWDTINSVTVEGMNELMRQMTDNVPARVSAAEGRMKAITQSAAAEARLSVPGQLQRNMEAWQELQPGFGSWLFYKTMGLGAAINTTSPESLEMQVMRQGLYNRGRMGWLTAGVRVFDDMDPWRIRQGENVFDLEEHDFRAMQAMLKFIHENRDELNKSRKFKVAPDDWDFEKPNEPKPAQPTADAGAMNTSGMRYMVQAYAAAHQPHAQREA